MNGGTLGKILAKQVDEPSVLGGLLNYRKANKELKNVAIPKSKVTQIEVKTPQKTGMENLKINRNDISYAVPESVIRYIPSNHKIPVRNLSTKPTAQPEPEPSVAPLNRLMVHQSPGWREGLANVLTLQAAMGSQ